ncbi:BspA family leucine-rich repeat surface protein [Mycoplasma mycoides subsp. capri]|uniref:BspA family leucine-rich repeat surface protein n=1 Tax=Mycoplasma mycoides TaxID=2102 RepID=UPI002240D489|nr:BspA family leucine-rich repeat surface protein [Mycoplasma mycoides]QVK01568.1 BspA family leucine-rich repeat surface protein [Mycoplasma mycoides subsp. capri]
MKLKKTVWIPLVCTPVLLTAIIVPPVVIYKNKQKVSKPIDNKKPVSDKQPIKPIPQPKKPIDELKPIIDPNITTLNKQLKEASTFLTSTLSNKKYKNLEKLQSEISAHLTNNNNSFNNISFEITNKASLPQRGRNQTVNLNLKATGINNKSSSLSTTLNNVSLGILDIDEIISRKKMWVEIEELESFKNNNDPSKVKEDFFYLLKKNNYDNLDESIFNKDSYTYDFSETEIKDIKENDSSFGSVSTITRKYFDDNNPEQSWYETKMKIKKNKLKNDFIDWNNKDELEFKLYAFIDNPVISSRYSPGITDFIAIDKNGDEKRISEKEVEDSNYSWRYNYKLWEQNDWLVEEIISWNFHRPSPQLPKTIKRVPKYQNENDLSFLFWFVTDFNQDISTWDVSRVKSMDHMFFGASSFNQDLSKWNTSNVSEYWQNIGVSNPNWKPEHWPQFKN